MAEQGLADKFDILAFQVIGSARPDPRYMFESTTYTRIFAQAKTPEPLSALKLLLADQTQQKPSVSRVSGIDANHPAAALIQVNLASHGL